MDGSQQQGLSLLDLLTYQMAQLPSASFGPGNQGLQVGHNHGPIIAEFHLPPGKSALVRAT